MAKLNVKLVSWTLGLAIAFAAGVYFLHLFQTKRVAQALLWQARRAEKEERLDQASKFLSRYLELVPQDTQERANLGRILANDKLAVSPPARAQAFWVLEQVVANAPDQHDLRHLLVRVAMDLGRYDVALEHLKVLQKALPKDGDLKHLLGKAYEYQREYAQAKDWYEKAIADSPQQIDSYERLANLLSRRPDQARANHPARNPDQIMDQLVVKNDNSFRAHLTRWRYLMRSAPLARWRSAIESGPLANARNNEKSDRDLRSALEKARQDIDRAIALAPDKADVLLAAAEFEQAVNNSGKARKHLQRGLALHPHHPRMYQALATLELRAGKPGEAVACLRRGVKALTGQGQDDTRWTLANLLIDSAELADARKEIAQLGKANSSPAGVDYLQARLLIHDGKWAAAAKVLERTRALVEAIPELTPDLEMFLGQVDRFLGQCYEQLDDPGRQCAAYGRLVTHDPSASARLKLAAAHWALGRLDEAIDQYRQVLELPTVPAATATEFARLLFARNLQRDKPDWEEVTQAIDKAEKAQPGSADVVLLRAEVYLAQNQALQARKLLEEARDRRPKQIDFWIALASLAESRGQQEEAERLLEQAERQGSDSVDLRLARARHWANRRREQAEASLAQLEKGLDKFSAEDQSRLLQGLAEAYYQIGLPKEALRLWGLVVEQPRQRNDLRVQFVRFDLALQADDDAVLQHALNEIHRIEGGQGTFWRYGEALRLIHSAKQGETANLDKAHALLDAVGAQRSEWPAVFTAKAQIEELKGNPEQALAHYREALNLGERNPRVVRQLVQLLHQRQRYGEADQVIRRLQKQAPLSADLQRLAVDLALRNHDPAAAIKMAHEVVATDSKDYRDYLWLGQVLAASGQRPEEAERNLRRAVDLGGQVPETWVALVEYLASTNQKDKAEVEVHKARARLASDQADLALAQCYEALGRTDQTLEHYRAALSAKPDDVSVLRTGASFYLRTGRLGDAEPILRKITDERIRAPQSDADWARRNLALILSAGNDYERLLEALALVGLRLDGAGRVLVDENKYAGAEFLEEERARARVLATPSHQDFRGLAIALLEDLAKRQALTADDQFQLAQLYQMAGDWPKARELFRNLVAAQGNNPIYLAHYAQSALRQRDTEETRLCIERLKRLEKDRQVEQGTFGTIELEAQVLEASGAGEQAIARLKEYVNRKNAKPEEVLALIGCLARQKHVQEALESCEQAWRTCPPVAAGGASVAILRSAQPNEEQVARVERWLKAAIEKNPGVTVLLLHLADLRDLQNRFADAQALYRQVLKQDKYNVIALNNLAWLLAQSSDGAAEAQKLIDLAIKVHGPRTELLDTRAMVSLTLGQFGPTIKDLEEVTAKAPTASRYFHLASAQLLAHNRDAAAKSFAEAQRRGFHPNQLHPLERKLAQRVTGDLESR